MKRDPGLRRRLFWTLFFAALVPTAVALAGGTWLLRGVVASTGSAGPWEAVAESGRELLERIEGEATDEEVAVAAARHREILSESLRLSQVYALVGERVVVLLPAAGLVLLLFTGLVAALATGRLARGLSAPAEELAGWIRALGEGRPLPAHGDSGPHEREVREFRELRSGLIEASERLAEARRREEARIRAQSWAEMARRVAHELKNPLMPMRMASERVARAGDPATAEAGEVLLEEIARLDGLARSFAQFGRPEEGPPAEVDLTELLAGTAERLAREGATIEVELPAEPLVIEGHLAALERIVRNLLSNAFEAAPEGGIRLALFREGSTAVVRVEDEGPGIDPEILDRIWEPDFTTRRRGTGLGLPLVRKAVEGHEGEIEAGNRDEGGAWFEVRLPLGRSAADTANPSGGGQT